MSIPLKDLSPTVEPRPEPEYTDVPCDDCEDTYDEDDMGECHGCGAAPICPGCLGSHEATCDEEEQ